MPLLIDHSDKIATVTLDRPERMNAISPEMGRELEAFWREFEAMTISTSRSSPAPVAPSAPAATWSATPPTTTSATAPNAAPQTRQASAVGAPVRQRNR